MADAGLMFREVSVSQARLHARVSYYERQKYRVLTVRDKTTIRLGRPKGDRQTFWARLHTRLDRRVKADRTTERNLAQAFDDLYSQHVTLTLGKPQFRTFTGAVGALAVGQFFLFLLYFTDVLALRPYVILAIGLAAVIAAGWTIKDVVRDIFVSVLDGNLYDQIELSLDRNGKVVEQAV